MPNRSAPGPGFRRLGHPARTLIFGALLTILVGGLVLQLPACARQDSVPPGVAFFTATSAVCVTGLTVVDTPATFSPLGQAVILLLVQVGGLGYMTASMVLALVWRRRPGLQDRLLLRDTLGEVSLAEAAGLFRSALRFTLVLELAGAAILAARFLQDPGRDLPAACWLGLCNAVSAFCNADFVWLGSDGAPGSLGPYRADLSVNLTVTALIILGGLGFAVCREVAHRRGRRLSLHSRTALAATGILLAGGTVGFLVLEWGNPASLAPLPLGQKVLAAFFQTTAVRTAGFSTLDLGQFGTAALLLLTLLMFIGASPGGTGGGLKTTTVSVVLAAIRASLLQRPDVELGKRRLPAPTVARALALIIVSIAVVELATGLLSLTDGATVAALGGDTYVRLRFEVVSALATAGISTGVTPLLSEPGRGILMVLMLLGRLGLATLATAAVFGPSAPRRRWPEEMIPLG